MIPADLRVLFGHCGICFFWNIWLAMTNSSHYYKRSYSYAAYTFTTLQITESFTCLVDFKRFVTTVLPPGVFS